MRIFILNEKIISLTVILEPSWKLASGLIVKRTYSFVLGISIVSAINPYIVNGSSKLLINRLSEITGAIVGNESFWWSLNNPDAGVPFNIKGFRESNVAPGVCTISLPPLGAKGST